MPEWFGIPSAVDDYVAAVATLRMLVADLGDGERVGFLSIRRHFPGAAEACVLGAKPAFHRRGIGTALFQAAERALQAKGCRYLTVKTLAASHPDPHYAATLRFYEAIGFEPLEVLPDLWGPSNPCLVMIKPLSP